MSYTTSDDGSYIDQALNTRDIEAAYIIRDQYAREGDDEMASYWNELAKTWEKEDWAYDNSIGN
jgi:hypothetical protein